MVPEFVEGYERSESKEPLCVSKDNCLFVFLSLERIFSLEILMKIYVSSSELILVDVKNFAHLGTGIGLASGDVFLVGTRLGALHGDAVVNHAVCLCLVG